LAQQQALEQGADNVSFAQVGLAELVATHQQQYQLVLCHAMLEWLAQPELAIAQLRKLLLPGGVLSLMFYNKDAKRLGNISFGNFDNVAADFQVKKKVSLNPKQPFIPTDVLRWSEPAGFSVLAKTGVRCFHDYLR